MTFQQPSGNPLRLISFGVGIGVLQFALMAAAGAQLLGYIEFVDPSYSLYFVGGAIILAVFLKFFGLAWASANVSQLDKANWPWVRLVIAVGGGLAIMAWQGGFSAMAPEASYSMFGEIGILVVVTFAGVKLRKLATVGRDGSPAVDANDAASVRAQSALDAAIAASRAGRVAPTGTNAMSPSQPGAKPRGFGKREAKPPSRRE